MTRDSFGHCFGAYTNRYNTKSRNRSTSLLSTKPKPNQNGKQNKKIENEKKPLFCWTAEGPVHL